MSYFQYWDLHNLNGWVMLQKIPVKKISEDEDFPWFNEDLMRKKIKDISSKLMFNILKNYMTFIMIYKLIELIEKIIIIIIIMIYNFYQKESKFKNSKNL